MTRKIDLNEQSDCSLLTQCCSRGEARRSTLARLNLPDRHTSLKLKVSNLSVISSSPIFLEYHATFSCINLSYQ